MLQKQTLTVVLIAGLAGFLGGVASQQFGLTAFAQSRPVEKIEAQEFRLVNKDGKTLGVLTAAAPSVPEGIQLFRSQGGVIVGSENGTLKLFDSLGETIWSAPEPVEPAPRFQPLTESR